MRAWNLLSLILYLDLYRSRFNAVSCGETIQTDQTLCANMNQGGGPASTNTVYVAMYKSLYHHTLSESLRG